MTTESPSILEASHRDAPVEIFDISALPWPVRCLALAWMVDAAEWDEVAARFEKYAPREDWSFARLLEHRDVVREGDCARLSPEVERRYATEVRAAVPKVAREIDSWLFRRGAALIRSGALDGEALILAIRRTARHARAALPATAFRAWWTALEPAIEGLGSRRSALDDIAEEARRLAPVAREEARIARVAPPQTRPVAPSFEAREDPVGDVSRSLAASDAAMGEEHAGLSRSLVRLGRDALRDGRINDAVGLLNRAVEISRAARGDAHPETVDASASYAAALARAERFEAADEAYAQALAACEPRRLGEPMVFARIASGYAGVAMRLGRAEEAAHLFERSLAAVTRARGPDHGDTATAWLNLGHAALAREAVYQAADAYAHALRIRRMDAAPDKLSAALVNLATARGRQGRAPEALALLDEAEALDGADPDHLAALRADICEQVVAAPAVEREPAPTPDRPPDSPPDRSPDPVPETIAVRTPAVRPTGGGGDDARALVATRIGIGDALLARGETALAKAEWIAARALLEKAPDAARARALDARLGAIESDDAAAERMLTPLVIAAPDDVDDSEALARALGVLVAGRRARGEAAAAVVAARRCVSVVSQAFGAGSSEAADALFQLGGVLGDAGRRGDAALALLDALAIWDAGGGAARPEAVEALTALATYAFDRGEMATALDLFGRAAEYAAATWGGDAPQVADALCGYAAAASHLGAHDAAAQGWTEIVRLRAATGAPALTIAEAERELGAALASARRYEEAADALDAARRRYGALNGVASGPRVMTTVEFADVIAIIGDSDRALALYGSARAEFDADPGLDRSDGARIDLRCARLLARHGLIGDAAALVASAAGVLAAVLGENDPETLEARQQLGALDRGVAMTRRG